MGQLDGPRDGFGVDVDPACHRGLRESVVLILPCIAHASCGLDCLLDRFGRRRGKHYSSSRVHPSTQVGHGRIAGVLHSRHSDLLRHETFYEPPGHSPAPSQLHPLSDGGPRHAVRLATMGIGSRPPTNCFDLLPVQSPVDYGPGAPSDVDLERSIEEILQSADLNMVTRTRYRKPW